MRIAIASDDGTQVAQHTGRCQGFMIFDVDGSTATPLEYRPNGYTAHAQGLCDGHDHSEDATHQHHSHAALVDGLGDCCGLITRGLGPRLIADLLNRGIVAYITTATAVQDAAEQFAGGQLKNADGTGCCCRH
jgi:predicted Fe-Mo cluster-binding NifX family protein